MLAARNRRLGGQRGSASKDGSAVEDGFADRFGSAETGRLNLGQRPQCLWVETHADG
jgi:hypothetical protein